MTRGSENVSYNAMAPVEMTQQVNVPLLSAWPVAEPPGGLGFKTQFD